MDDRYDRSGLYHDADDPRIFVPKRDPSLGWTINVGHRYGRLALLGIVIAVFGSFIATRLLG